MFASPDTYDATLILPDPPDYPTVELEGVAVTALNARAYAIDTFHDQARPGDGHPDQGADPEDFGIPILGSMGGSVVVERPDAGDVVAGSIVDATASVSGVKFIIDTDDGQPDQAPPWASNGSGSPTNPSRYGGYGDIAGPGPSKSGTGGSHPGGNTPESGSQNDETARLERGRQYFGTSVIEPLATRLQELDQIQESQKDFTITWEDLAAADPEDFDLDARLEQKGLERVRDREDVVGDLDGVVDADADRD